MLRILNSLSREKEPFSPLDPAGKRVNMYTCGPTVYDSLHIGHIRAYLVPDVVRRFLEYRGYQVRHATNFTDVDDKIIRRAVEERRDWREITATYIDESHRLLAAMGIRGADVYPRATDHIPEMIEIVARLLKAKNAYVAKDGDLYFDTSSYANYGKLSGRKLEEEEAGLSGRVSSDRLAVKKNPGDFVLWKLIKNDKPEIAAGGDAVPRWSSPWGDGRPGWHLECSAMSQKYLGVPFDIHCGGQDLLFPHHEDEKAQTECAFCDSLRGKESVRYWVHNAFITVKRRPEDEKLSADLVDAKDGSVKMSKSLGNVKWAREMIWPEGPYDPMAVRMMLLSSHYRSPIVFEPAMLDEAAARLDRIYTCVETIGRAIQSDMTLSWRKTVEEVVEALDPNALTRQMPLLSAATAARTNFEAAMDDDFNTAGALGAVFELVTKINQDLSRYGAGKVPPGEAASFFEAGQTIRKIMGVLGFRTERAKGGGGGSGGEAEKLVDLLLFTRSEARNAKQFILGDRIRDALNALGYEIEDLPGGKSTAKKK